jgi:hypothetical protein
LESKEDGQGSDGSESMSVQESPKVAAVPVAGFWTARVVWNAAIALIAVGTIAATWLIIHGKNSKPDGAVANIRSVAVLPVASLSGDSNQEYLTDGFTDQLITELARNTSASVISRTSIMRYKNRHTPLPMVAQELGVDAVVETSLQNVACSTLQAVGFPSSLSPKVSGLPDGRPAGDSFWAFQASSTWCFSMSKLNDGKAGGWASTFPGLVAT